MQVQGTEERDFRLVRCRLLGGMSLAKNGVFGNYQLELADNETGGRVHDDEQ